MLSRVSIKKCFWTTAWAIACGSALMQGASDSFAQQTLRIISASEPELPADQHRVQTEVLPAVAPAALRLADLESWALANNPSLNRASALVGAAQGNWIQAGLRPNPAAGYEGQQLGSGGLAEQHGVSVSQEIVRGGKLRIDRAVANQELESARQALAAQQQRVLTDVRLAFYQVLIAQRQIDLANNVVRISTQGATAADALFRAKEGSRIDILQAQLEVENARILSHNARNRHDAAWRGLGAVVGVHPLPMQPLDGDVYARTKPFDFEETLRDLQAASPEIAMAMTEVSRARYALERARAERVPNLSIQGVINVVDNGIGGNPDGNVSMSVPLPIFNRNQGGVLRAQHELAAAQQAFRQMELDLQLRLASVFERYANARNQVDRYRSTILPAAEESLELSRKTYEAGEANYLALLTAQRTFSQTNLNYLDSIRELRTAEVEIEGLLLRDSLRSSDAR